MRVYEKKRKKNVNATIKTQIFLKRIQHWTLIKVSLNCIYTKEKNIQANLQETESERAKLSLLITILMALEMRVSALLNFWLVGVFFSRAFP